MRSWRWRRRWPSCGRAVVTACGRRSVFRRGGQKRAADPAAPRHRGGPQPPAAAAGVLKPRKPTPVPPLHPPTSRTPPSHPRTCHPCRGRPARAARRLLVRPLPARNHSRRRPPPQGSSSPRFECGSAEPREAAGRAAAPPANPAHLPPTPRRHHHCRNMPRGGGAIPGAPRHRGSRHHPAVAAVILYPHGNRRTRREKANLRASGPQVVMCTRAPVHLGNADLPLLCKMAIILGRHPNVTRRETYPKRPVTLQMYLYNQIYVRFSSAARTRLATSALSVGERASAGIMRSSTDVFQGDMGSLSPFLHSKSESEKLRRTKGHVHSRTGTTWKRRPAAFVQNGHYASMTPQRRSQRDLSNAPKNTPNASVQPKLCSIFTCCPDASGYKCTVGR